MHPDQQLAQNFLQEIHQYYPIGLPHFEDSHPGFQQLRKIQLDKFAASEREEPKLWYDLVKVAQEQWGGKKVFNSIATPFPCYELGINLSDKALTGLRMHSSLTLSVSLLVKYYAIVVTDSYAYMGPENSGASHQFVCSGLQHHLELEGKIEEMVQSVRQFFPEYRRANHNVLFNYKVLGGYPYPLGYDDLSEYTIYDYLFSNILQKQRYTVVH